MDLNSNFSHNSKVEGKYNADFEWQSTETKFKSFDEHLVRIMFSMHILYW